MLISKAAKYWCMVLLVYVPAACIAQQQAIKDYPSKPIRLVVPFVAGGANDVVGYVLGQKIGSTTGQHMFIDNHGGAGGAIGTDIVAKSAPDGYTILLSSIGFAILPSIAKRLPYDPLKDFTPITLVARSVGYVLLVHPSLPVRSVREFILLAKAQPQKLNYGSGGVGSPMHFAAESFNMIAGTQMTHVPYQGIGRAIIDLVAGRIEVSVVAATVVPPYVRSNKLRALGIAAPARWSELPEVPTMQEAGLNLRELYT